METLPASVNPALDRFTCARGGVAEVLFKVGCALPKIQVESIVEASRLNMSIVYNHRTLSVKQIPACFEGRLKMKSL